MRQKGTEALAEAPDTNTNARRISRETDILFIFIGEEEIV